MPRAPPNRGAKRPQGHIKHAGTVIWTTSPVLGLSSLEEELCRAHASTRYDRPSGQAGGDFAERLLLRQSFPRSWRRMPIPASRIIATDLKGALTLDHGPEGYFGGSGWIAAGASLFDGATGGTSGSGCLDALPTLLACTAL